MNGNDRHGVINEIDGEKKVPFHFKNNNIFSDKYSNEVVLNLI